MIFGAIPRGRVRELFPIHGRRRASGATRSTGGRHDHQRTTRRNTSGSAATDHLRNARCSYYAPGRALGRM